MFKTSIIISLVILSVIIATLNSGMTAAVFSLFAFSLLFYFVLTQKTDIPPSDET